MRNKFELIKNSIKDNIDIFMISETKLDDSFPLGQFLIEGFTLYRRDRDRKGGGIMFFVREDIPSKIVFKSNNTVFEGIAIEINLRKQKWLICFSYNPHKNLIGTHINHISNILDTNLAKYEKYLVIGDLNAETEEPIMREFCDSYNLKNLIKEPTCFKNPSNPSCIDLMLTNSNRSFQNSLNIETGLSDFHKMTVTVLKTTFPKVKPKIILYRNYKKNSNYDFREEIIPLVDKLDFGEVDKTFESFQRICINTLDKHAPKKQRHVRANQSPFINNKLNKAIMNRSRLRNRFLKNKTEENKKGYNRQRNYVVSLLKKYKDEYYNNLNTKDIIDNKKFWTTVKPLFFR